MLDTSASVEWQRHTRPEEGLAFIWEPVATALRYVFVAGLPGVPAPPIDDILRGATPCFTCVEISRDYSGAVDVGSPVGAERAYSLFAVLDDRRIVPIHGVHYARGFDAPQDRDYYAVEPEPLSAADAMAPDDAQTSTADTAGASPPHDLAGAPRAHDGDLDGPLEGSSPRAAVPAPPPELPRLDTSVAHDTLSDAEATTAVAGDAAALLGAETAPGAPADAELGSPAQVGPTDDPREESPVDGEATAPQGNPPSRPAALSDPALTALLDEAELCLRPQWSDYTQAAQLLEQARTVAPDDGRLHELQDRLRALQADGGAERVARLLHEAGRRLEARDYWQAVDIFEQVLAYQPENQQAQQGVAQARALGRWAARMTAAGADPEQMQRIGNEYAKLAPDLAGQAYAAAFHLRPTIVSLRGWLLSLARSGQLADIMDVAQQSVRQLRQCGRVGDDPAQDEALSALREQVDIGEAAGVNEAVAQVIQVLVTSASNDTGKSGLSIVH